jgi:hypothetical protein
LVVTTAPQSTTRADSFCVCDFPFRLWTNVCDAQPLIAGLYRDFVASSLEADASEAVIEEHGGGFSWRLGEKAGTNSTLPAALWNLEAALCETILHSQRRSIAIHAATIRIANSVVMLAGRSDAGKTTLSLALARRGLVVAGDDVALVDPDTFNVMAIPRCFHVDDRGAALLEADGLALPAAWERFRFITPNDFGARAEPPGRARWLIFMRGPRGEHPDILSMSQAEMTARLLSETGKGPLADSETIAAICGLAAGASCFALTPGPLGETADVVAALVTQAKRTAD